MTYDKRTVEAAAKAAEHYNFGPERTERDSARNATAQIIAEVIRALPTTPQVDERGDGVLADTLSDALDRYKGEQHELGGWLLMNADRILAALSSGDRDGVLRNLQIVLDEAPEINPSIYDHDDVCLLNAKMIEARQIVNAALPDKEPGQ